MRRNRAVRWTVVSLATVVVAALGGSIAAEAASAMYCDVVYRSCLQEGEGGGDSYEGSAPRPQYMVGQVLLLRHGHEGWDCNHAATCRKCDDNFEYVGAKREAIANGWFKVEVVAVDERGWFDWFC